MPSDVFSPGADRIVLAASHFAGIGPAGGLAADSFAIAAAATDADDRIIYDSASGAVWFDADGTGSTIAIRLATLDAGLGLSAADFAII